MAMLSIGDESPWGEIDHCDAIIDGMAYSVDTPSHGGVMLAANSDLGRVLSDAAWDIGLGFGRWMCFEEDLDYIIAYREIMRLGYGDMLPDEVRQSMDAKPEAWLGSDDVIRKYYPRYAEEIGI